MTYDVEIIAKIASPILTLLLGAVIKHYTERRSKLVSFLGHISSFKLRDENQTPVFTHGVVVRNAGCKSAIAAYANLCPFAGKYRCESKIL
jgi:hypothetical protein